MNLLRAIPGRGGAVVAKNVLFMQISGKIGKKWCLSPPKAHAVCPPPPQSYTDAPSREGQVRSTYYRPNGFLFLFCSLFISILPFLPFLFCSFPIPFPPCPFRIYPFPFIPLRVDPLSNFYQKGKAVKMEKGLNGKGANCV